MITSKKHQRLSLISIMVMSGITILFTGMLNGCAEGYHLDRNKAEALRAEVPKSMGGSFSNLLQQTGVQVSAALPLRYPTEWSKDKMKKEFASHAHKYGGNVIFIERDGKLTLNSPDAYQESYWADDFLQQPKHNSFFHWETDIADDFALDGSIAANYILQKHALDLSGYRMGYFVVLVKNDKIVGYITPYPAHGGEIEYIQSKFGFFVY
jgi:hypothetical protein